MFCSACGAALAADAKFCTQCGKPVSASQADAPPLFADPPLSPKPFSAEWFKQPQKYGRLSVPRYLVLIVAAIAMVAGLMSITNGVSEIREGMGGQQNGYPQSGYKP